jgi:gluconokinase
MPAVEGLRSPYDKSVGGLHHLGRMIDKIRLQLAGRLPADFQRNYGLSVGADGILCGFLNVAFADVEARLREGGADAEIAEWIFARGLRPSRAQAFVWNEFSRKIGWNDRVSDYLTKQKAECGFADHPACTSFAVIELTEGREPPAR